MAETAQTAMSVYNIDLLAQHDVTKYGEEGKHCGKRGRTVDDGKGYVVDLDSVGEIADAFAIVICVSDDNYFVAPVNELGRELVDVTLDSSGLREEEVAHHGDIVGLAPHVDGRCGVDRRPPTEIVVTAVEALWLEQSVL